MKKQNIIDLAGSPQHKAVNDAKLSDINCPISIELETAIQDLISQLRSSSITPEVDRNDQ